MEAKYQKAQGFGVTVEIAGTALIAARAQTKVQKARNLALRQAFELLKLKSATAISGAKVEFDWELPTRKAFVDGEPAFLQYKDTLRCIFVGKHFESVQLSV